MNKKISFPITIAIIVVCAVLTGLVVWKYGLIPGIGPSGPLPKPPEKEVTITTDKTEYGQGEVVKINVLNNSSEKIFINVPPETKLELQKYEYQKWITLETFVTCPCGAMCEAPGCISISPGETLEDNPWRGSVKWDQIRRWCENSKSKKENVSPGKYRFTFDYWKYDCYGGMKKIIYSNEFTIREKKVVEEDDKYNCRIDEDCAIKIIDCDTECSPCPCIDYGCINKNIEYKLYCPIPEGVSCPPSPPWVTNCKCINSKCVDCRGEKCHLR